jgi:hypothetical protein
MIAQNFCILKTGIFRSAIAIRQCIADGPDEVHSNAIAKLELAPYLAAQ